MRIRTLFMLWLLARRTGIAVIGGSVLLLGLLLVLLPGPAFLVIPVGLGILALEFSWARRLRDRTRRAARDRLARMHDRFQGRRIDPEFADLHLDQ